MPRLYPLLTISVLLIGCAQPRLSLDQPACRAVNDESGIEAIEFRANIATENLAQQQLLYEIGLLDTRSRPVPARTYRYKNAAGQLAAGRSLMVLATPWVFENVTVSIPGSELKAVEEDRPAWAEFRVLSSDRAVLARQRVRLPPTYAAAAAAGDPIDAPRFADARRAEPPPEPPSAPETVESPPPADPLPEESVGETPPRRPPTAQRTSETYRRTSPSARASRAEEVRRLAERSRESAARSPDAEAVPTAHAAPDAEPAAESPPKMPDDAARAPEPAPPPPAQPDAPAGTAPAPPAPAANTREYVVRPGDTLIAIAKRELNDPTRWYEIFDTNRDVLHSPDEVREGMTLRLPPAAEEPPPHPRNRRP